MADTGGLDVLAVSPWGPWRLTDGSSLVLHHHLRMLGARHRVTLLTVEQPPADYALPGVTIRSFAVPSSARDYVVRRVRGAMTRTPSHVFYVERPELVQAFDAAVVEHRPDVLHLFGWGTAQLVARAPQVPSLHVAVDQWSVSLGNRLLPGWRRWAAVGERGAVAAHERHWYPRQGAVVLVAEADATALRRAVPGGRFEVVPNGVEPGPRPGPLVDDPVLVFHGALVVDSNVAAATTLVRDVLPRVQRAVPDARVLLVGRDPVPAVRALAGPDVEVTGFVPEVRTELDRGAVYVAPLVSGTGLKNKVLEAMAAGLPVVGTPLALEGIGGGDGTVEASTPDAIAAAVVALLADRDARAAAQASVRARAEQFTWGGSAARIESLWRELARTQLA